jgi:hypothetical protein
MPSLRQVTTFFTRPGTVRSALDVLTGLQLFGRLGADALMYNGLGLDTPLQVCELARLHHSVRWLQIF